MAKKHNNQNKNTNSYKKNLAKQHTKQIKDKLKEKKDTGLINDVFVFTGPLSIADFAAQINKPVTDIVKYYFNKGMMINQNTILDEEQIGELALEFGFDFKKEDVVTTENIFESFEEKDDPKDMITIPPVVTIMGHVDHGKTTLLDALRHTNVTKGEAGGITQAIGAYQVITPKKRKITFIDTPGHEAFSEMRSRGANVTNIVVLVVAADDGVMPQTKEAIDHAKLAKVPMIVFINKMDKPDANPDKVKEELANEGVMVEDWGGDVPAVAGSARTGQGFEELLDTISAVAELQEIKANPKKFARGVILEAHLDKGRGPVATALVESGTLHPRDIVVSGGTFGSLRDIRDAKGKELKQVAPHEPAVIVGLDEVPLPGDKFMVINDEKMARTIAEAQKAKAEKEAMQADKVLTLDQIKDHIDEGDLQSINVVIKADTQGSVEALKSSLAKIDVDGVKIDIVRSGVGAISLSDVTFAKAANAIIYGFNVRPNSEVRRSAQEQKVEIRLHDVIYKLIEELESAAKGLLEPTFEEKVQGQAEVRALFRHSAVGTIAGCHVTEGVIKRKDKVRIMRNGVVIYSGEIDGLKHEKDDIKEAKEGSDCGITIKNYNDIKEGDVIESYYMKQVEEPQNSSAKKK